MHMSPSSRLQARERELGRPLVPAARRRAAELGVDLATVAGTGRNGVVRVADVEAAAGAGFLQQLKDALEHPLRTVA
jgi:pyruvate/2-oxoglutarate dehydrogenase complex dihydrolipoamide acyltransferase (E2) component